MVVELLPAAIAGFLAQMVDGALGMGYGVTSASLLLATGMAPAVVAATVKFAQLGTTLASGASHWQAKNVEGRIVARLAVPGGIGALVGATVLSALSLDAAAPVMSALLLALGILVVLRFTTRRDRATTTAPGSPGGRLLIPLGLVGGLVDSTGGGGWGPVVTSTLLTSARTAPRTVIGSVAAAEFVVTVCASIGFLLGLGLGGVSLGLTLALMIGGVLAAPIAARLAGRLPAGMLGVLVGSLIITLNLGPTLTALAVAPPVRLAAQIVGALLCLLFLVVALRRHRASRTQPAVIAVEDRPRPLSAPAP
ncbi:sulfite exporter TauE/SafE family protein [Brachybacterium sp. FME24]|uniref:sulfite exporter TauE/SafE family protein n=1 Tax=Brachybacterium sp. FME24 TaxID=2742605 RepID=UPI00271536F7|nr:sulfite exporter TauE/SafE family protein [Brachybacterium sp. FME24]